jgi:hypothetical protein
MIKGNQVKKQMSIPDTKAVAALCNFGYEFTRLILNTLMLP